MAEPWDRLPGEGPKAWAAFQTYLNMDPSRRSLAGAYRQHTGREQARHVSGCWTAWYGRWNWRRRAEKRDAYDAEVRHEENQKAIAKMAKRHAAIAANMQAKLVERLQALDTQDIPPSMLPAWLDITVRVERLARGVLPNTPIEQADTGPARTFVLKLRGGRPEDEPEPE